MTTWTLPEPLDFQWKMKPPESARTNFHLLPNDSFELTIEHDPIKGVTPKMLDWWFRNIGGDMVYQGKTYSRYRVWHPIDHIHWALAAPAPDGSVGQGSEFHIVEAFNANMDWLIDSIEHVEKLDETGIRLVLRKLGTEVFRLEHWFEPHPEGTLYRSRMQVGAENTFGMLIFQPLVRPFIFTEEMGYAWLKHNIEEVGNFEFFLPELYEREVLSAPAPVAAQG